MEFKSDGPWYYEQIDLGLNYRMTDIHAALGISQLKKIDTFVSKRHEIASIYNKSFEGFPIQTPYQSENSYSSYHLYVIKLNIEEIKISHLNFFKNLRQQGIGVNLHYMPVYLHPYYRKLGFKKGYCVEAERYYSSAVSIPMYPNLKNEEQDYVIKVIKNSIS